MKCKYRLRNVEGVLADVCEGESSTDGNPSIYEPSVFPPPLGLHECQLDSFQDVDLDVAHLMPASPNLCSVH